MKTPDPQPTTFIGVDLAWQGTTNHSGIVVAKATKRGAILTAVASSITSFEQAAHFVETHATENTVAAIDAPLVITNVTGRRECESLVSRKFGARHASAHSTNLTLYPGGGPMRFVEMLQRFDFANDLEMTSALHRGGRWMFEVYPHPAQVVLFDLPKILKYKKGTVSERRKGLAVLREYLAQTLADAEPALVPGPVGESVLRANLETLGGGSLKEYEDVLDAWFCTYLALYLWWWGDARNEMLGDLDRGFIVVPTHSLGNVQASRGSTLRTEAPAADSTERSVGSATYDPSVWASPIDALRASCKASWPMIASAEARSIDVLGKLEHKVSDLASDGTSIVVFGSLARRELTTGSDADWALLLDGPADLRHFQLLGEISERLDGAGLGRPGPTGTFATFMSSHELIHHIGGTRDTNENLTRRVLLLVESTAIGEDTAHARVLRGILARYVQDQIVPLNRRQSVIPHFLFNDVVRYWRTMTVDYAAKRWERSDSKWALKHLKLGVSRKLLFVAGLIPCLRVELDQVWQEDILRDRTFFPERIVERLFDEYQYTPLETLARFASERGSIETATALFSTYDAFLTLLDDEARRTGLEQLSFEEAGDAALWHEARDIARRFGEAILTLFYDEDAEVAALMRRFGVF